MHPHHRTPRYDEQYAAQGFWDWLGPHMPTTPFGINAPSILRHGGIGDSGGRGRDKKDDEFPWATFAWVSLGIVGAGVLVYAVTKGGSK